MALLDQHRNLLADKEEAARKLSNDRHTQTEEQLTRHPDARKQEPEPGEQGRALADNPRAWLNDYKSAVTPGESVEPAPLRGRLADKAVTLALDSEPARVNRIVDALEGNEKEPTIGSAPARMHEEWKSVVYDAQERQDRGHIESVVGIAPARDYQQVAEQGDIRTYEHYREGGRLHLDSAGQFYTQEGSSIERTEASDLQRLTAHEWRPTGIEHPEELTRFIRAVSEESVGSYLKENRLGSVAAASEQQRGELAQRIQERSGLSQDNANYAVADRVVNSTGWSLSSPGGQRDADRYDAAFYTLTGEHGAFSDRQWKEEQQAASLARPYVQQIVAAEGFSGANEIDSKQREALTATLARDHNLNPNIAGEGVRLATNDEYDWFLRKETLSEAVGQQNAGNYAYKASSGDIDSFQHRDTGIHVHIDREGNFYNQAREVVNASAALSYAEQQYVVAPANRVQSSENLLPLPADTPAAAQQAVKVSEPVAKLAAPGYAPEQALSF